MVDDVAAVAEMEGGTENDDLNLEVGLGGRGIVIEDAADGGILVLSHYAPRTETRGILGAVLVEEG